MSWTQTSPNFAYGFSFIFLPLLGLKLHITRFLKKKRIRVSDFTKGVLPFLVQSVTLETALFYNTGNKAKYVHKLYLFEFNVGETIKCVQYIFAPDTCMFFSPLQ